MAVDLTYCRPVSHDRAYFAEPLKMLAGRVDAPAFNLRNELKVLQARSCDGNHLYRLHQYTRDPTRSDERQAVESIDEDAQNAFDRVSVLLLRGWPRP